MFYREATPRINRTNRKINLNLWRQTVLSCLSRRVRVEWIIGYIPPQRATDLEIALGQTSAILFSMNLLIRVLSKGNWKLICLHWHILTVVHNFVEAPLVTLGVNGVFWSLLYSIVTLETRSTSQVIMSRDAPFHILNHSLSFTRWFRVHQSLRGLSNPQWHTAPRTPLQQILGGGVLPTRRPFLVSYHTNESNQQAAEI